MTAAVPPVVVMGVTGAGKTTLSRALAAGHGFHFYDADDFHPPDNVGKMRAGVPLTDADRAPWLDRLATLLAEAEGPVALACSALKASYRAALARDRPDVQFVHLQASPALIRQRLDRRAGHYMPTSLIDSQFATLEAPESDDKVLTLPSGAPVEELCKLVMRHLSDIDV